MKTEAQGLIFTPFEIAEIPKLDDTLCYQDWGGTDHVIYYCWEHKQLNPMKGGIWQYLPKLHMHLFFNPSVSFIKIDPKGIIQAKTWNDKCTLLFIATLVIAKDWKWPKCPSARDWLEKLQPSHIMKLSKAQGRQPHTSGVLSRSSRNEEATLEGCIPKQSHSTREHKLHNTQAYISETKKADESKATKRKKQDNFQGSRLGRKR